MNSAENFGDEELTAFLDGELPEPGRSALERRLMALAAAIVVFVAGGATGLFLPGVLGLGAPEPPNWRAAVADYLTLYTRDTLASIPDDADQRATELRDAGTKLALDL